MEIRRASIIAVVAAVLPIGHAPGDLIYFERGGQAQLSAKVEGIRVRLATPEGLLDFSTADFARIVPDPLPLEEWPGRLDLATKQGTVEARFAAAWWALENGLTDEAIATLRTLRPVATIASPAARAIDAIDRSGPAVPDPDLEAIRSGLLPLRFREVRSPHAVLFHQHGEAEALERLELIERVAATFSIAFAAQGIKLSTPAHRLVSVYFAERSDYVEFLRRLDGDAFADTQGYYQPILRAVFAFDARSSEEQKAGRRWIANRRVGGESPSELARRALLLDLDWRATDLGILAHETVHQLTEATGLAPRFDDFPTWLHEGLAAQFEVVRGGRWAGFGRANDRRLPDWRAIRPAPRVPPLLRDAGFGRGYRRDLYAESWGLVYFLRKAHDREFVAFLDLLRSPRAEATPRPDRVVDAFRSAFGGDLPALESEWHRFLAGVTTPLERGRPDPTPGPPSSLRPGRGERRLAGDSFDH